MSLPAGTRLGSYEIVTALGTGGMGEVYRAKDTKLGREVALKILPASFTNDPERVARFRREAQVLASLNHPHIAQIYGLEEANGTQILVLELVDGESLDKRIAHGPIPVDEALGIAKQIAEALEAAHEKGIIHRDLKPANIALTKDGQVKVLDFGLAKAVESTGGSVDAMNSPTITSPLMTNVGVILGTAAYMSPEQARGKTADKRADIWAFGCVFYEMLTGKRAFEGEDVSETLAAILRDEPNWTLLPVQTPSAVSRTLRRCLTKDVRWRLQHIGDARLELADAPNVVEVSATSTWSSRRVGTIGVLAVGAAGLGAAIAWTAVRTVPRPVALRTARFTITPPESHRFLDRSYSAGTFNGPVLTISPDGQQVAYAANGRLYLRRLSELVASPIRGSDENPYSPVFSPDGKWIAHATRGQLKKIASTGGVAIPICDAVGASDVSWTGTGLTFVVSPLAKAPGIYEVADTGGTPQRIVASTNTERVGQPQMLPDGDRVLFTAGSDTTPWDDADIVVQSVRTGNRRTLVHGGYGARLLPTGHLLYMRQGTAIAQPVDSKTLQPSGAPVGVVENVLSQVRQGTGDTQLAVAARGTLAYVSGTPEGQRTLVWVDRTGREEPLGVPPGSYIYPVISPDGTQLALNAAERTYSIAIWHFANATLARLTTDDEDARYPVWTSDSKTIIYSSGQRPDAQRRLVRRPADGTGLPEALTDPANQYPFTISPDNKSVVFRRGDAIDTDLFIAALAGDHEVTPLVQRPLAHTNADISPDGRWIAYQSNETAPRVTGPREEATFQIYVQPFPNVAEGRWLVSTRGGSRPRWSRSGRELFYVSTDHTHIMMVRVTPGTTFTFERAVDRLDIQQFDFPPEQGRWYDVSADGERFLLLKSTTTKEKPELILVENWFEELKQRVPTK